jgi:hypothetical protein
MDLLLTKKQILSLLEQDAGADPAAQAPTAGTSSKQSGGQGYPEVGKWESGLERGPANQVGVTKWADVVGSKLKRGKANTLKEQEVGLQPGRATQIANALQGPEIERRNKIKQSFDKNYFVVKTPNSSVTKGGTDLILPKVSVDGTKTTYSTYQHPLNPDGIFKNWVGTQWDSYIPSQKHLEDVLPNGTLRSFTIGGIQYIAQLKLVNEKTLSFQFLWYFDKDNNPYNPNDYIQEKEVPEEYQYDGSWWAIWGQWTLTVGSILAATFIPGAQGLWISIGLDLVAAADLAIREKDNVGAGISVVLAFVPVIGQEILGIGKAVGAGRFSETSMNPKKIQKLAKEFAQVETQEQAVNLINNLPPSERLFVRTLLKEDPNKIGKLIEREIYKVANKRIVNLDQSKKWVNHLNNLMKSGKIDKSGLGWWYNTLNLKKLGWDLSVSAITLGIGSSLKPIQQKKEPENIDLRDTRIKSKNDVTNKDLIDAGFTTNDTTNNKPIKQ